MKVPGVNFGIVDLSGKNTTKQNLRNAALSGGATAGLHLLARKQPACAIKTGLIMGGISFLISSFTKLCNKSNQEK